jgi:hypothetical protein
MVLPGWRRRRCAHSSRAWPGRYVTTFDTLGLWALRGVSKGGQSGLALWMVSRSCACIGSLCLRHCAHGAPIGGVLRTVVLALHALRAAGEILMR